MTTAHESIHSLILIVQKDANFGNIISQSLLKDRQNILGPTSDIKSAYKLISGVTPTFAIIDASISKTEIQRLSDSLMMLGVQHVINCGDTGFLIKRSINEGEELICKIESAGPLDELISQTLWGMHIEDKMFHWLEDAVMGQKATCPP